MGDQEEARPTKKARGSSPPPAMGSGSLTAFALHMAKKLAEGDDTRDSNIAFLPLSLYTSLGLVAAGACGRTLDELLALFGATSTDEVARFVQGLTADPSGSGETIITYAYGVFHQKHMSARRTFSTPPLSPIALKYAPSTLLRMRPGRRPGRGSTCGRRRRRTISSRRSCRRVH
ncbi:serpin-Z2B-like [Triticum aestivum]|uniref:serpin-Z2B-like n=1 Tax=Triticum aestivum TaxID=4565 RepID=UPI001D0261BB|nr:serpin-Z2B-like [Triticum aestivum]